MKVGIVGAGIGGLCTAIGLHRAGAQVTVFEQAEQVRSGGSGLSVFGNGLRALESLGLGERFVKISSAKASTYRGGQRRPDGSWLSTYPADALKELRIVDRGPLHQMLLEALPADTIRTHTAVASAVPSGKLTLQNSAADQRSAQFDLVVAADGASSKIRASLPGDPGLRYSGYSTWRGITAGPVDLGGQAGETWGVKKRFGAVPLADGRVYWFAVLSTPRTRRDAEHRAAVEEHFAHWHEPIPQLIKATNPAVISYLPIDDLASPLSTYVHGRVVLLGDAAHAMTPNLGQGGGQAMEDAATLARLLEPLAAGKPDHGQISHALAEYDRLRLKRTQRIARRSRLIGRMAHSPGPHLVAARDLLLKATPPSTLRKQLKWIQDWTPPAANQ